MLFYQRQSNYQFFIVCSSTFYYDAEILKRQYFPMTVRLPPWIGEHGQVEIGTLHTQSDEYAEEAAISSWPLNPRLDISISETI